MGEVKRNNTIRHNESNVKLTGKNIATYVDYGWERRRIWMSVETKLTLITNLFISLKFSSDKLSEPSRMKNRSNGSPQFGPENKVPLKIQEIGHLR